MQTGRDDQPSVPGYRENETAQFKQCAWEGLAHRENSKYQRGILLLQPLLLFPFADESVGCNHVCFLLLSSLVFLSIFLSFSLIACSATSIVSYSCDPIDRSPPASSPRDLQVRILERVAIPFSRDLPHPGITPTSPALPSRGGKPFL